MNSKAFRAIAVVSGALIAGVAVGSIALATSPQPAPPPAYDHISNTGAPVGSLSTGQRATLEQGGAAGDLNVLRRSAQSAFYEARGAAGGLCFATGGASGEIEALVCPSPGAPVGQRVAFPSKDAPILDLSPLAFNPTNRTTTLLALRGFAADGVTRVGVVDKAGVLHATDVVSNTYDLQTGPVDAATIIAFDASGAEIYRQSFDR